MYQMNRYELGRLEATRRVVELGVEDMLDKQGELLVRSLHHNRPNDPILRSIVARDISDERIGKVAQVDFRRASYGDYFNYRVMWERMRQLLLSHGYTQVVFIYDANWNESGMGEAVLWFEKIVLGDEKRTTWEILGAKFSVILLA